MGPSSPGFEPLEIVPGSEPPPSPFPDPSALDADLMAASATSPSMGGDDINDESQWDSWKNLKLTDEVDICVETQMITFFSPALAVHKPPYVQVDDSGSMITVSTL